MNKNAGITLVALVITIIILLILAGVAISMITGGEGLFAQANGAATKYNQAAKNEADLINQLLNGNYLNNGGNGQGGEEDNPQVPEEPEVPTQEPINNESHVGYYADLDPNDGKIDGIIFADQAVGNTGSGTWNPSGDERYNEYGAYTIPVKTGLKEYYVSKTGYEGIFGTKAVLTPKAGSAGEDRFYIMSLENFGGTTSYTWYHAAKDKMTDYAEATSIEFGKGRANTAKMIEYWNNKTYGEQNTDETYKDMWGEIQGKVAEGWFVPSRGEWAAFAQELGITKTNYGNFGLSLYYWSSSQGGPSRAWYANFSNGSMYNSYEVGFLYCVRLCVTF